MPVAPILTLQDLAIFSGWRRQRYGRGAAIRPCGLTGEAATRLKLVGHHVICGLGPLRGRQLRFPRPKAICPRRLEALKMTADSPAAAPPICLVLSTGRCGSTTLSNIVRAHPLALSVSELFSALGDADLSERELDGPEFWGMLSTPCQADIAGLRCGIKLDEQLYPAFDPRPGAERFNWATGLPPVMQVCLPHLTDRPDDLYARAGVRDAGTAAATALRPPAVAF